VKLNIITLALITVGVVLIVVQTMAFTLTPLRIAGLGIAIPGFILLVLARIQLGKAFSVEAKATTLVTTGLYSRIRNPIYVFGGLMIAGVILWFERPLYLLVFVILIPMQVIRARKEAQVLEAQFGQAYVDYKKRTWF
jgi:protein-S-isoprenylcysteine O-methyltransferase Ste14